MNSKGMTRMIMLHAPPAMILNQLLVEPLQNEIGNQPYHSEANDGAIAQHREDNKAQQPAKRWLMYIGLGA